MVLYNFKSIHVVPDGIGLIDIVLSKVQRKTPTEVHKRFKISRIREFYMRKVKFAQQTFRERLTQIVEDFPRLDSIHPFYADLINVLYDRDHYKLALGHLNIARNLIDNIGKDYIKLMKFGDSLYRLKLLKKAALGRMCTLMKKQNASLQYLEQVRQHLARLPSIDPNMRTLLITGYPNCGKSSFINHVTRADVDVQPYAFTTKSLFVGHLDYKYLRWQVIDTPGILDHPLEERNTIEMQAITALAHLRCAVLFFLDISGQSEYSVKQQVSLFRNISPLFADKPLVLVASKADVRKLNELDSEESAELEALRLEKNLTIIELSNITTDGVNDVKSAACESLLEDRVQGKINSKKVDSILNRIHVAIPKGEPKPVHIPESVLKAKQLKEAEAFRVSGEDAMDTDEKRRTLKDIEQENGGAGVFNFNLREHWELEQEEWKDDNIPEIYLGKNVSDFYDPDIEARLEALEAEENELLARWEEEKDLDVASDLDEEVEQMAAKIKEKRTILKVQRRMSMTQNKSVMPRKHRRDLSSSRMKRELSSMGLEVDTDGMRTRGRSRAPKVLGKRSADEARMDIDAEGTTSNDPLTRLRAKSQSRNPVRSESCFRDESQKRDAQKMSRKKQRIMQMAARKGEGDRHVPTLRPKHLFSGKRGIGKTDWR